MTSRSRKQNPSATQSDSRRQDRLLPVELLGISLALGIFTGLIVLIATREFLLAGIALGVAFIVTLVLFALFALGFKPNAAEISDLDQQNSRPNPDSTQDSRDHSDPHVGDESRP